MQHCIKHLDKEHHQFYWYEKWKKIIGISKHSNLESCKGPNNEDIEIEGKRTGMVVHITMQMKDSYMHSQKS